MTLREPVRQEFLNFCTGNAGLKITYDPFFKYIFNPVATPERLSDFLSCILGKKVFVKSVLPLEGGQISHESPLLILDILVELEDGTLTNVEIQKVAYKFLGERIDCYLSDLLLRQYNQVRSTLKKEFSYKALKPVYTIVIYESSYTEFHHFPNTYIHRGSFTYDTGLKMEHLQKSIIIALDIFRKNTQTINTELDAWLYFLTSDDPKRIWEIQKKFPSFRPLYHDIFQFRKQIKEVLGMYSEALRIMDRNTVDLMVDEMRQALDTKNQQIIQQNQQFTEERQQLNARIRQLEAQVTANSK